MSQETCHPRPPRAVRDATVARLLGDVVADPLWVGRAGIPWPHAVDGKPMSDPRPVLYVCLTCRAGRELAEGAAPPGALLHAELARLADASVTLRTVTCMASCETGCAAAIAMPGKWTNLLGRLDVPLAADLLAYARLYAASPTGTVMPSKRPASLPPRMVLGRVPDMVPDVAA